MSRLESRNRDRAPLGHRRSTLTALVSALVLVVAAAAQAQAPLPAHVNHANWELANKFSTEAVRRATHSTSVQPHYIGKTDSLWYLWRDRNGSTFYLVFPPAKVKRPLFDHVKLAAALSAAHHKPYDPSALPFNTFNFTKDHKAIRFTVDTVRYEWALATETIKSLGRPPRGGQLPDDEEREEVRQQFRGRGGFGFFGGAPGRDFRNFSPDSTAFAFARDHNLFLVEVGKPDTLQLTTDGAENYSFGFRDTTENRRQLQQLQQRRQQDEEDQQNEEEGDQGAGRDPRVRANVTWSPDSKAFYVTRNDSRKVKELYLVNVLADPRPVLLHYSYAMPGEENVPQMELYVYKRGDTALTPVNGNKWKDQRLMFIHWTTGSDKLRLVRRDRLQRNLELIEVDLGSGAITPLITESVEDANLEVQNPRYTRTGGDLIWWSERSGWGHYYLYDFNGHFKRPLTSGAWRADNIVDIDTVGGAIWISGVGREPGENVYYRHTYRMNADGSGFTLVDPGDFNHSPTLSPTKKYFIDNYSRVDAAPRAVVRDATGRVVMDLEEMDLTDLEALGWKPPETFVVKAADGVTDIYGNMWKPFDFDSTKKYPIIANVYPGPQTESVITGFTAGGVPQQLAQLGFIVIQIGNRGGSPLRSNAYQNFSYFNLRDYALADKKAGIEELAAQHPWIDIERVGIYGHSGGGFLTGAAMLLPPYNDFFKVGVASSGNHDNNIYNQNWSEQYHGLKVVRPGADSGAARGRRRMAANGNGPALTDEQLEESDSVKFSIHVPTNIELAPNLKGSLLLVTGDLDNNVHPGNTIRLVNALIKADKRFDFMLMPGKPHAYGDDQPYFTHMLMEYFAEHLLGDYYRENAEIK
jgi:dipeptidyl-peptidase-4